MANRRSPRRHTARSRWRRQRLIRRGLVAALIALAAGSLYLERIASSQNPQRITYAAVASRDLPAGTTVSADDIAVTEVPLESPVASVGLDPAEVVGRSTYAMIAAGEMFTATRFLDPGAGRPGRTTMPISFPDPELATYLTPGMLVDLVWTPNEFGSDSARVVARDVLILRIGAEQQDATFAGAVSVLAEVREEEAVDLAAALNSGSLSVLLKTPGMR